jgi:DNA-binding MarR family transcriptional regulator
VSSEQVAEALARLFRSLSKVRARVTEQAQVEGMSWSALMVLRPLVQSGPQRSSALADALCLDPSWISRQVAQLVQRGLVERRADPRDGRVCILAATEAGLELSARLQRSSDAYLAGKVAGWSAPDRRHLAVLLGRFAAELENDTTQATAR